MQQRKDEIEFTLPLRDIEKIVKDSRIKELISECERDSPGEIGGCVEDKLLDRLVEIFSEEEEIITPIPMKEWVESDPNPDDGEACRPCALPVTLQWYAEELRANGEERLAKNLENTGLTEDPLTTAEEMDNIKDAVGAKLRERLLELDATTQANV